MELHIPASPKLSSLAATVAYVTDGLDAVVIAHRPSLLYPDSIHLVLAGNQRDLATAAERAKVVGGKVD